MDEVLADRQGAHSPKVARPSGGGGLAARRASRLAPGACGGLTNTCAFPECPNGQQTTLMGKQVEFSTRSARGRQILDGLERETGMPPAVSSGSRRVYDLGAGTLDADALLRALRRLAPDWYEHLSYLTLV